MTNAKFSSAINEVASTGTIGEADVLRLRRDVFGDGFVSEADADGLFFLNDRCEWSTAQWPQFFVEALTDYVVHQAQPEGYVSKDNASWLMDRIASDGRVKSATELELLIKVLEAASSSPEELVGFALNEVKQAVLTGDGAVANGRQLQVGVIGETEVQLLRRILYAFGGDGGLAITRSEAEILFDLNDATVAAANHPSWSDLFVKAVANFMLAASGYRVPNREVALRRESWLDEQKDGGVGSFMSSMLSGGLRGILDSYRQQDPAAARNEAVAAAISQAEKLTEDEARWLRERMGRDGVLHENEKALLRFIRDEAAEVHPLLKPLIEQAA